MLKLKNYAAMFAALIVLLTTFNQTVRAGSWSWDNVWSVFSSAIAASDCTIDPVVVNGNDDGAGSLRQAVIDACAGGTITFSDSVNGTVSLLSGQIVIDKNLTIAGPGADSMTIRNIAGAGPNNRIFNVNDGVTATIAGLTISDGNVSGEFGRGGAIVNGTGNLTLADSIITGNLALFEGGGIYNYGNLTVSGSLISENGGSSREGLTARGGGIHSGSPGILTITDSSVSFNNAGDGGGIYIDKELSAASLALTRSSIIGNIATKDIQGDDKGEGGGIYNEGDATLTNSTVRGNLVGFCLSYLNSHIPCPVVTSSGIVRSGGSLTLIDSTVADDIGNSLDGVNPGSYTNQNSIVAGSGANFSTGGIPDGFINTPYSHALVPNRGAFTYSLMGGTLPAGVSLLTNGSVVSVSGTTDLSGTFYFSVKKTDGTTTSVTDYSVRFYRAPTLLPPGGCLSNPVVTNRSAAGAGTLVQAISDACAGGTITFSNAVVGKISSGITIDKNLTIAGPGAEALKISGLSVNSGVTAAVSGLTSSARTSLGILNRGNLTITNVRVFSNSGGGIYNQGNLTVAGSIIGENGYQYLPNFPTRSEGGGIYNVGGGTLSVIGSTISGNSVASADTSSGGGIFNDGTATITNSTVSGNIAFAGQTGYGGGIFNGGNLSLVNSTVANNSIEFIGSLFVVADGCGIANWSDLPVNVGNSIVAGNTGGGRPGGSVSAPDFEGALNSQGYNLIGNTDQTIITGDTTGNILNTDARLGPLADNGGATPTHALLAGSPAINAGSSALAVDVNGNALTTDQRGAGFPRLLGASVDIGAFESSDSNPTPTPTPTLTPTPTPTITPTITPTPSPDTPPVAANDAYSVNEDATLNINAPAVLANDADGENDALTASLQTSPANAASFTLNADGSFSYTPNANFNGTDSFTYTASDGINASNSAIVSITVNAVNDAPFANSGSISTDEDTPAAPFALSGSDQDNDALTFQIVAAPVKGSYNAATGVYTPNSNANGSDSFTFIAKDAVSQSAAATISITITPVNDAPTATNQSVTTDEDAAKMIALSGSDPDGDALTYSANQPSHGSVSCTGANCTYTPAANYNGSDSFTFKTNDGQTDSAAATVSVTVTAVNDLPTANGQSVTTDEDTPKTITLMGSDPDGADVPLTYTIAVQPANGTLSGTGANLAYTPGANYNGTDSFTFRVNDGALGSASATVIITVTAINDNPTAVNDSATTGEDTAVLISALVNDADVDGDTLSVASVGSASRGVAVISNGNIRYTPNANVFGVDSFAYTVSDGNGGTATATITVTVNSVNDLPTAANDKATQSVQYSDPIQTVTVTGTDVETAASALTAVRSFSTDNGVNWQPGLPAGLVFTPGSNGASTVSGVANVAAGSHLIRVTITDADQGSASTVFTILVSQETTATDYTGDFDLMTAGPAVNTATVRLAAKLTPDADNSPGDLTKATVTFKIFKFSATAASFTISNVPVDANGDAVVSYTLPADVYTVRVEIDGGNRYWTANPINDGMLNITVPTNEQRSSGGGWIADATSANGKAHLAFSVSASKNGQPKGNLSFSYKGTDGFTYLVKSNSWQGGYLQFAAEPEVTPALYTKSNLKGGCTVQKIDPLTGLVVASAGGYTFETFTRDGDLLAPRQRDSFSITIRNGANTVFHQVGSSGSLVPLGAGNITNKAK